MVMMVVVAAVVVTVTVIMITNHVLYSVGISNHIIPDIPARPYPPEPLSSPLHPLRLVTPHTTQTCWSFGRYCKCWYMQYICSSFFQGLRVSLP